MDDLQVILDILEAGGNSAMVFIAYCIYRLDRRVYRLELLTVGEDHNEGMA